MFINFENVENITNKKSLQSVDVKIYSANKIRFGEEARKKLDLDNQNVIIQRAGDVIVIGSTNKESGVGRPVNAKGEFSHETIAKVLGGQYSEWEITGDGQEHLGVTYYVLSQTVNGAEKRAELEVRAQEAPEQAQEVVSETTDTEEVHGDDSFTDTMNRY